MTAELENWKTLLQTDRESDPWTLSVHFTDKRNSPSCEQLFEAQAAVVVDAENEIKPDTFCFRVYILINF